MPLRPTIEIEMDKPVERDPSTGEMVLLLTFGQYRNEPALITDEERVHDKYLLWMVQNDHTYQVEAIAELHQRGRDPFDYRDWEEEEEEEEEHFENDWL